MEINFVLDCIPTAQMRVRHVGRIKKEDPWLKNIKVRQQLGLSGDEKEKVQIIAHKANFQIINEREIQYLLLKYIPKIPIETLVQLEIKAFFPAPRSFSKEKRQQYEGGEFYMGKKPDIDNCVKNILDCMTKVGFWKDDDLVCKIIAEKKYSNKPRWEISLQTLEAPC